MEIHPTVKKSVLFIWMEAVLAVCVRERETAENCLQKSADTYPHTSLPVPALKSFTVNINQFHPRWHVGKLTLSKILLSLRYNRIMLCKIVLLSNNPDFSSPIEFVASLF